MAQTFLRVFNAIDAGFEPMGQWQIAMAACITTMEPIFRKTNYLIYTSLLLWLRISCSAQVLHFFGFISPKKGIICILPAVRIFIQGSLL